MFKRFILVALISTHAFAATVVLEKQSMSGFVMPEYSFNKRCTLLSDGHLESTVVLGHGAPICMDKQIPKWKVKLIQQHLTIAKDGVVEVLPFPCDVGSSLFKGWIDGELVELDNAKDCDERRLNNSPTVPLLKDITVEICGF